MNLQAAHMIKMLFNKISNSENYKICQNLWLMSDAFWLKMVAKLERVDKIVHNVICDHSFCDLVELQTKKRKIKYYMLSQS